MILLNSKSILDCNEFEEEKHNEEIRKILSGLSEFYDYKCAVIIQKFDKLNKKEESIIKQCNLHKCYEMLEYVDYKNGTDLALVDGFLTFIAYGQGYMIGNDYCFVQTGIQIRPYNEKLNFINLSFD